MNLLAELLRTAASIAAEEAARRLREWREERRRADVRRESWRAYWRLWEEKQRTCTPQELAAWSADYWRQYGRDL